MVYLSLTDSFVMLGSHQHQVNLHSERADVFLPLCFYQEYMDDLVKIGHLTTELYKIPPAPHPESRLSEVQTFLYLLSVLSCIESRRKVSVCYCHISGHR